MTAQDQVFGHHSVAPYVGLAPYMVKAPTVIHASINEKERQWKKVTFPQGTGPATGTAAQQNHRCRRIEYQGDSPIPVYKAPHLWELPASVKQQPVSFAS